MKLFALLLAVLEIVLVYAMVSFNMTLLYATELAAIALIKSYDEEFRRYVLENRPLIESFYFAYIEMKLEEDLY